MSDVGKRMPKEYSDQFDKLRQNRVEVSFTNTDGQKSITKKN